MIFQLQDLSTGYRGKHGAITIASDLNATIPTGSLTCLLGPNGAGKSTLLRTLSAFLPPLGGSILIDGKDIRDFTPTDLSKIIGMVLTERVEVQGITVREMVAMGRSPYTGFWGRLTTEDEEIVQEAINQTGIQSLAERQVSTLSDGERQKVMIAKALAQQTPLILLDEPTAFLDFPSKVEMMLLLRRLAHEQQKAIFLSTHDLDLALQTADLLWLLAKGEPLSIGIPKELAQTGVLPRFFNSRNIEFDTSNLTFRIRKER